MRPETQMVYWLNPTRPDYQFRTNNLSCWRRKVGEEKWKIHESIIPEWPNQYRYQVSESELQREEVKVYS